MRVNLKEDPFPFGNLRAVANTRTDANGLLQIPLHSGFRGYLETSAPPAVPDLYPALLYVLPVPDKNVPAVLSAESMVGS